MSGTPRADTVSPRRSISTRRITPVRRGNSESNSHGPTRSRNRSRSRSPEDEGAPGYMQPVPSSVLSASSAEPDRGQLAIAPTASVVGGDRDELMEAVNGDPNVFTVQAVRHVNITVGEVRPSMSTQDVRMELEEMHQSYQERVQHFRREIHQYENHRDLQTHYEIAELQNQLNSAVMTYRSQAETLAEQRIARERTEHDSERIFQNNEHMAEMAAMQTRLQQNQRIMEDAVREHQQAQQQNLQESVIQERERVIAEAQSALQDERIRQNNLIQEMERNRLSQEERLRNAQGIISGLQRTIADQTQMAEDVTRAYQQSFIEHERQQARLARDREEQQKKREDEANRTISKLTAEIFSRDEAQRESPPVPAPDSRIAGGDSMQVNVGGGTPCRRTLEGTPRNRTQELIKVREMKILEDGKQLLLGKTLTEEDILYRLSLLICQEDLHILSIMAKMVKLSSKKLRL